MPIEQVRDLDGAIRRLTLSTGSLIDLRLEDDAVGIYANDAEVGRLSFRCGDEPPTASEGKLVARLIQAFVSGKGIGYQRHGVATEAVSFFLEYTGYSLELPKTDQLPEDPGSSAFFIASLRRRLARGAL